MRRFMSKTNFSIQDQPSTILNLCISEEESTLNSSNDVCISYLFFKNHKNSFNFVKHNFSN